MTYNGEEQDESKKALSNFRPLFEQSSYATKGTELVMNSENGISELVSQQEPIRESQTELMLKSTQSGGIFGGGTGSGGTGSGGTGSGGTGSGGNTPTAKEIEVTATVDKYDRLRLFFVKNFGYKIKETKDFFDWLRDAQFSIRFVSIIIFIVSIALVFMKKTKTGIALGIVSATVFIITSPETQRR